MFIAETNMPRTPTCSEKCLIDYCESRAGMKRDWMRVKLDRFFQRPRSSSEEQSGQNDMPMENSGIEVPVPNETDEGELRSEPMDVDGAGGSSSSESVRR